MPPDEVGRLEGCQVRPDILGLVLVIRACDRVPGRDDAEAHTQEAQALPCPVSPGRSRPTPNEAAGHPAQVPARGRLFIQDLSAQSPPKGMY